jgi:hypothetical protein
LLREFGLGFRAFFCSSRVCVQLRRWLQGGEPKRVNRQDDRKCQRKALNWRRRSKTLHNENVTVQPNECCKNSGIIQWVDAKFGDYPEISANVQKIAKQPVSHCTKIEGIDNGKKS